MSFLQSKLMADSFFSITSRGQIQQLFLAGVLVECQTGANGFRPIEYQVVFGHYLPKLALDCLTRVLRSMIEIGSWRL